MSGHKSGSIASHIATNGQRGRILSHIAMARQTLAFFVQSFSGDKGIISIAERIIITIRSGRKRLKLSKSVAKRQL